MVNNVAKTAFYIVNHLHIRYPYQQAFEDPRRLKPEKSSLGDKHLYHKDIANPLNSRMADPPRDKVLASRASGCLSYTKPLKNHPNKVISSNVEMFSLNIIPMTLYEDIMPYFNNQIHAYGCNQSIYCGLP